MNMSNDPTIKNRSIGVGVIGSGDIASIYLQNLPAFAGVRLVACAGRNPTSVAEKASAFGIEAISIDTMLRRADIEIVVNLTPPSAHAEITSSALAADKHVYSEKPLATTALDGRSLLHDAQDRGLMLGCAPDTFLGAAGRMARTIVDEGRIGRIIGGTCMFMSHGMEHRHPNPEFFFKPGGGPMHDIGPYYLTMLVNLLGPVERVQASTSRGFDERLVTAPGARYGQRITVETPTTVQALLSFSSGATITCVMSWDVWRHDHGPIELYGTEGSLRVCDPDTFGGTLAYTERHSDWRPINCATLPFGQPNWHRDPGQPLSANYRGLGVADMASSLLYGTPHRTTALLAAHVLDVMDAVLESAALDRTLEIKSSIERPAALPDDEVRSLQL